jgi:TonB family protein
MRPVSLLLLLSLLVSCSAPAPEPEPLPEPVLETPQLPPMEAKVIRSVRVTASALNVRKEASTEADVVAQVKRNTALDVLSEDESWVKVRLASGEIGWVAARFVSGGAATTTKSTTKKRKSRSGCPPDSDYAFETTPTPSFSDRGAHGIVVVEANVNASGTVTRTRVISNSTGDESLAFLAEREIKGAKFSPPIRSCVPRAFIFSYRRAF